MNKIILVLIVVFFLGCSSSHEEVKFEEGNKGTVEQADRCQSSWEDGAFYGYYASQDGATASNHLVKAYEIKTRARERVKAQEEELKKYR